MTMMDADDKDQVWNAASTSKLSTHERQGEAGAEPAREDQRTQEGPSASARKRRFQPIRHLYEPPTAPAVDAKLEEEAAAQNIAQQAGFEGRRVRKFLQRRTVDWNEEYNRWSLARRLQTCARADKVVRPGASHVVELLPAAAYRNSAQAVTTNLVHTSTNKIRCPVNVVRWTPEGRRLLTGSSSGEFTLWNGLTYNFETILQVRAFCPTGVVSIRLTERDFHRPTTMPFGPFYTPNQAPGCCLQTRAVSSSISSPI